MLVHGDLHEGQLLVDAEPPHALTGILDWQTARVDHPFVEFDLGEWGTAMWRGPPDATSPSSDVGHGTPTRASAGCPPISPLSSSGTTPAATPAGSSASGTFPVAHGPGVVGTLAEARAQVRASLRSLAAG